MAPIVTTLKSYHIVDLILYVNGEQYTDHRVQYTFTHSQLQLKLRTGQCKTTPLTQRVHKTASIFCHNAKEEFISLVSPP